MAEDESALREVDRAVAEDQQWAALRKNGPALVAGAVAIVAAVGGWQIWTSQKAASAGKAAVEFRTASETLREKPEDGRAALETFAEDAPGGYAALADMRIAGSLASGGDREGALAAYRKVYKDAGAPKRLKELARLRAAALALTDGREAVLSDLGDLTESDSAFGPYARELAAFAAFGAKDYQAAADMFAKAAADEETPEPVRQRAEEMAALAVSGKSGVNLTGEARVEDLMKSLGDEAESDHSHEPAGAAAAPDAQPAPASPPAEETTEPGPDGVETQDQ